MTTYKLIYKDGTEEIVNAENTMDLVRKYDLVSKKHMNTIVKEQTND